MIVPDKCVIDASVGAKLFLPEECAEKAQDFVAAALADERKCMHVPDLFFVECANVLWKAVARLGYPIGSARTDMSSLRAMGLMVTPTHQLAESALEVAYSYSISAYDACYVALAESLGVPMVTADGRLAAKLAESPHRIVTLEMV